MYEVSEGKDVFLSRISPIVNDLFKSNSLFIEKLNKIETSQHIIDLFKKLSVEEFISINDKDLRDRIDGILVINATAGMLNDLTPEEIEVFDAAVEGR